MITRHYRTILLILSFFFLFYSPAKVHAGSRDSCSRNYNKKIEKSYNEGTDYFKRGNYTEAGRIMKSVINEEPEFVDAWFVLGLSNYKKVNANLKEAEKNFLKVLELCPSYDAYTYYYMGEICYGSERYDSAIRYLSVFIRMWIRSNPIRIIRGLWIS